jgi:hypothetical protein
MDIETESSFFCSRCGKTHQGLPTDLAYTLPDDVWAIPEPERSARTKFTSDLCEMGERRFFRCLLEVPFVGREGYFGWGVWVEVEPHVFDLYFDICDKDGSDEPMRNGRLANRIPVYEDAIGETVAIKFGPSGDRPLLLLDPDSECSLARDQRRGISEERYHEILVAVGAIQET